MTTPNDNVIVSRELLRQLQGLCMEVRQQSSPRYSMNLHEPTAFMLDGGVTIEIGREDYHAGQEWEPLYTEAQVKELLTQADKDMSDGFLIVHLDAANQAKKRYEPALKQALDELERVEAIMLRECGIGVVNRIEIDAIRKLLNEPSA